MCTVDLSFLNAYSFTLTWRLIFLQHIYRFHTPFYGSPRIYFHIGESHIYVRWANAEIAWLPGIWGYEFGFKSRKCDFIYDRPIRFSCSVNGIESEYYLIGKIFLGFQQENECRIKYLGNGYHLQSTMHMFMPKLVRVKFKTMSITDFWETVIQIILNKN